MDVGHKKGGLVKEVRKIKSVKIRKKMEIIMIEGGKK